MAVRIHRNDQGACFYTTPLAFMLNELTTRPPPAAQRLRSSVPGMSGSPEGASPSSNLMEVKDSEAQGRNREGLSEGSVEQRREPTNRNRI